MLGIKPLNLDRIANWLIVLRDLAALLFVPFLCAYAAALVWIIWKGGWSDHTQEIRIQYLGMALIGLLILVAFGVLWLQRREIPEISLQTSWGRARIGSGRGDEEDDQETRRKGREGDIGG